MGHENYPGDNPGRARKRAAILEYIRKIALCEQSKGLHAELNLEKFLELSEGETAQHHRRVNRGLKYVQGIPAQIGPPKGDQLPIVLQEWHGIDPEDANNHLWTVSLLSESDDSLTVSFPADELHRDTMQLLGSDD